MVRLAPELWQHSSFYTGVPKKAPVFLTFSSAKYIISSMLLNIDLLGHNTLALKFRLIDSPIALLWAERMHSRGDYILDHPRRFYGFDPRAQEIQRAESYIRECIRTINRFSPVIQQDFTTCYDQDCLNYLHSIFEQYHGLLDQQTGDLWSTAPDTVRQALAELNLAVHRCESVARGTHPRFVCTWYGMPKTLHLAPEIMLQYGTLSTKFGTVYLNYCEIGKTLEDLAQDRDRYISDQAFKPFDFYSADFVVKFWDSTEQELQENLERITNYYEQNKKFFHKQGYTNLEDPRMMPLRFPVAELVETMPRDQLLQEIQQRQHVSRVELQ